MEERRFRNKITWFTFFFSVLVIWVHSYNAVLFLGNTRTAYEVDALERFLGDQVAQIAVPGFFSHILLSFLPEFYHGPPLDQMEFQDQKCVGSLYRMESFILPWVCYRKPASSGF